MGVKRVFCFLALSFFALSGCQVFKNLDEMHQDTKEMNQKMGAMNENVKATKENSDVMGKDVKATKDISAGVYTRLGHMDPLTASLYYKNRTATCDTKRNEAFKSMR